MSDYLRENDSLNQYGRYCTSKIRVAPFLPQYAMKHELGASVAAAVNCGTLVIARAGYEICELVVQNSGNDFTAEQTFLKEKLDPKTFTVLKNQGSDFFGGAFYAHAAGGAVVEGLRIISNIAFPNKGVTRFIENNYRILRSLVGFTMLAGHEYTQVGGDLSRINMKDLAAYAMGITAISHGPQIFSGVTKKFGEAKQALFGKKVEPVPVKSNTPSL